MRRIALFAIAIGLLAPLLAAAPAHAQATRTWVSGVGDDANPCSRTAPCKTFAGAISKTAALGEINCLDSAGFGAVTITKSISIICNGVIGGILSSGTTGVIVNALGSDKVVLKGLDINGAGTGINGIRVLSAAAVTIEDCTIQNTTQWGIQINNTAPTTFQITRVMATNNTLGGIQVRPPNASAQAIGTIQNFIGYKNGTGISLDGNGGSLADALITDSTLNANATGISLATGGTAISAMVIGTGITSSTGTGLSAGANTTALVGGMRIYLNGAGVSGTVSSFGNNQLRGNGTDGTLTPLVPALQ